jgi:glutathione S-transferase
MTLSLYYVPYTRAGRARWMLEELEVPYELAKIDPKAGQNKTPEYLEKVHPLGHVPALHDSDGDVTVFESAAICMYLADKFPEKKLAPPPGTPARGHYYQWMVFSMAEIEPTIVKLAALAKIPEAERRPEKVEEARIAFAKVVAPVAKQLGKGEYLLGAEFGAVDVMMAGVLGWAKMLGALETHPVLLEYVRRCTSRPASKRSRTET